MKAQKIKPYYVAVEFTQGDKLGRVEIWKDYDPNFVCADVFDSTSIDGLACDLRNAYGEAAQ